MQLLQDLLVAPANSCSRSAMARATWRSVLLPVGVMATMLSHWGPSVELVLKQLLRFDQHRLVARATDGAATGQHCGGLSIVAIGDAFAGEVNTTRITGVIK